MGKLKLISKKRLKIFVPLLIAAVLAVAAVMFVKNMNGPAEGAVTQQQSSQTKVAVAVPGKYSDQFIGFTYPAHYTVVPSQKTAGYLDIVSLHNTDHSGKYVEVGLQRENLQTDPGYTHRKYNPGIYKQLSTTSGGAVFASSQNGSEQTGFITHGALVLSISLTANGNAQLDQDYNVIANSLQWK